MKWALLGSVLATASLAVAQEGVWDGNTTEEAISPIQWPLLDPRQEADTRDAGRPFPAAGIAAQIGPGETHVWDIMDEVKGSWPLSLSECVREPESAGPLTLSSGKIHVTTSNGGLAQISRVSSLNGTIVIKAPQNGTMWQYQLGAGNASSYAFDNPELYLVDSDFANSLVVTSPYRTLANYLNDTAYANTPYGDGSTVNVSMLELFVSRGKNPAPLNTGLQRSYCAQQQSAIINQLGTDRSTTERGVKKNQTRGQFLIKGLNRSDDYVARLALPPASGQVIGGAIFSAVPFFTKSSMSCQLIYNMSFCSDMAFTVPGNASAFTTWELTEFYNDMAERRYANFTHALNQVECNVSRDLSYSVIKSCDDCAQAYQQWLCAVTIPRCADWANNATYLKERPVGKSRNPDINEYIRPGKYKEILPCKSLCFDLVRNCPASLQFQCPVGGLMDESYGDHADDGDVTCSYPGAVYHEDGSWHLQPQYITLLLALAVVTLL